MKLTVAFVAAMSLLVCAQAKGRFEPSSGRLFFVGQDIDSIDEYVRKVRRVPAGVTGYTSVENLEGLTSVASYGTGRQNLKYLVDKYPKSSLAVGLYLKNQLDRINSGAFDSNLNKLIDTLAGFNRKIFLRFGYEADGAWNEYDPTAYVKAYKKTWDLVQRKGVSSKFSFVWHLASHCSGTYQGRDFSAWYPGDKYVDWVAVSTFTQYDCNWGPQNAVARFARSHKKPLMISEAANQGYQNDILNWRNPVGGRDERKVTAENIWSTWYAPWFTWIRNNGVKGVAYISADWDSQSNWNHEAKYANGYWGDSRVTVNSYILKKWKKSVKSWIHAK